MNKDDGTQISEEIRKLDKSRLWLYIAIGVGIIGLIAAGLLVRNAGTKIYLQGVEYYYTLDSEHAHQAFEKVSKYPGFLGKFIQNARDKLVEIEHFQQAENAHNDQDYENAQWLYAAFMESYPESLYVPVAEKAFNEIPFKWADQALGREDFENAIQVLSQVGGEGYSEISQARAQQTISSVNLQWGESLYEGEEYPLAIEKLTQVFTAAQDPNLVGQAEQAMHQAYAAWTSEAIGAKHFDKAIEAYQAYDEWLTENTLASPVNLEQALAETYQEWGDLLFEAESYPEAIDKYEHARAIEIPAITAGVDDRLALAYLMVGGQLWDSGSREEAVEHFASIILDHGTAPAAAEIPLEAASDLLAYGKALNPNDEFAQAAAVFNYLGSADLSEALAMENLVSWADVLYQSELDANYLESLRKLDQAAALAAQSEQELELAEVEALRGRVTQAISILEDGLGKLILHAIRAAEIDDLEFPICEIVDEEEVCLDEADYQLVMGAVGIDEDTDRFVHGGDLSDELTAKTPGEAQFFIRFIYTTKKIQSCPYTPSAAMPYRTYFLQRHRRVTEVVVTDLQTGFKVGYETFTGGEPQGCPSVRRFNPQSQYAYLYGPDPDASQIYSWLLDFTR